MHPPLSNLLSHRGLGRGLRLGQSFKTLTAPRPYGMGTAERDERMTFTMKEVVEKIRDGQYLSALT